MKLTVTKEDLKEEYFNPTGCPIYTALKREGYNVESVGGNHLHIDGKRYDLIGGYKENIEAAQKQNKEITVEIKGLKPMKDTEQTLLKEVEVLEQKLAALKEKLTKKVEAYKVGDRFKDLSTEDEYILARTGEQTIVLINLNNGNRYTDAIEVEDSCNILKEEFNRVCAYQEFEKKSTNIKSKLIKFV